MRKNRILLKVKFGNRCLNDVLPLVGNGNDLRSSGNEPPKVSDAIDAEFTEAAAGIDGLNGCSGNSAIVSDGSVSNICTSGNSIAESVTRISLGDRVESPARTDLEKLGTPVDKCCSGPGTSPDSEVIDAASGAPVSLKGIKQSPDLVVSEPACLSSRDALSLGAVQKGLKSKKKKHRPKGKDRMEKMSDSCAKGLSNSLGILNNEDLVRKGPSDASALTTLVNISSNVDTNELQSEETPPSQKMDEHGSSNAISEVELGERDNISNRHNIVSRDSPMTEGSLSPLGKLKTPESTRYQGVGKSQPEICSSSPKREHASKRKGNKEKKVGKCEEKEKTHGHIGVIEVKCNPTSNKPETNKLNPTDTVTNHVPQRNAWVQCDDCYKWRRISASLADKIEETDCRWICKDNLDERFADCSTPQEKSNSEINVELELSDMSEEEDVFDASPNRDPPGKKFTACQRSTWTLIKSNLFLNRRRKSHTIDEIMICHCKTPSSGRIGCGNGCLNRMLNIECIPGSCPCGEQCSNQQFQRRSYANLKWYKCGRKGYGLQLLEDVREGSFIIEYVGEVLDMHAYEARLKEYALKGHKHFYFMSLNSCEVIDACAKGNLGRFINHSCDPNCRTEKWIVNGEVCIGLFAVRDIKKGEELTFDYNYVRVVGAAAKKCVCGTPQCRGYIGGDPQNAEVIIQDDSDDEFPEPDVICEEDDMHDELENIKSASSLFGGSEERTDKEPQEKKEAFVSVECLKATEENGVLLNLSASSAAEKSVVLSGSGAQSCSSMQPAETSSPSDDITSETIFEAKQKCSEDGKDLNSVCTPEELEMASPSGTLANKNKSSKSKSATVRRKVPPEKRSRSSSCVKKSTSTVVNTKTTAEIDISNTMQEKSKKLVEGSSNGRFEAVEAKLNELLDLNGGISKSNDASKYYLKLLLLTAASGDSGNGEAIQSNRELSMILGALLKTKSRTVLADIINKNGLQMLHNIIKRFRREFNKTPILRKLLKVLEYLALREILTIDHINWVPSRPGVESFRESILALTDHVDKQVHQIARNFRDRWIPKPLHRKNSRMENNNNRLESTTREPSEAAAAAACSSPHLVPFAAKTRKRKSRWDEVPVGGKNGHNSLPEGEFPPGFSPPAEHCTAKQLVIGQLQHRFISRIMVSYGIPFNLVQKIGVPVNESFGSWVVAPGVPFHPFPPLPTYARGSS